MTRPDDSENSDVESDQRAGAASRLAARSPDDAYQATSQGPTSPRVWRRKWTLPVWLFLFTCASTFFVGACRWGPTDILFAPMLDPFTPFPIRQTLLRHWDDGLTYMVVVLAILLTHEMGHFLATVWYRVPASLPFCIPFPLSPFGTFGAVIGIQGMQADRKQMFDIGLGGPLAGLVVAIPATIIGVQHLDFTLPAHGSFQLDLPLAIRWLLEAHPPKGYTGQSVIWQSHLNPWLMAGWVGCFVTALNMMPIGQLDGGHVTYTLFGRAAHWLARVFFMLAILSWSMGWISQHLLLMLLMPIFIGIDHPPTRDDQIPLGPLRYALGIGSIAIPILCFPLQCVIVRP